MQNTEILKLPYIMPSQAQKHVTHNEAIRQLDALIQLAVVSADVSGPPSEPDAGSRYIIGENATGDWAGLEGQIAAYLDGNWTIFEPREGWRAYVEDQNTLLVRAGEAWESLSTPKTLNNMDGVGIGAQSDAVNKLAVASDASLFSHAGNGHQLKINKADESQTASLLFQSNWKGHAEFGLTGGNDFQVKVSPDGISFQTALQIDKSTGQVQFPLGAVLNSYIDVSGVWYLIKDNRWITFSNSFGTTNGKYDNNAGTGPEPTIAITQSGPFLRRGSRIRSLLTALRINDAELSAINIRLVVRYFASGQPWTEANMRYDVPYTANNIALDTSHILKIEEQIADYQCPEDGFLLIYVQPVGTITRTQYVLSTTSVEVVSA